MKRRMRFGTWCEKDPEDERKINYRFTGSDGKTMYFSSDDTVSLSMIRRLNRAWIATVLLDDDEWYADLYEDKI